MKVVIAGAGSVGRSVARELLGRDHTVVLIDRSSEAIRRDRVPGAAWVLADACDTPALPDDLVTRLCRGLGPEAGAAYARDPHRAHPLCALWRAEAAGMVEALAAGADHPPMLRMLEALNATPVAFEDAAPFANVNTPDDLACLPHL